MTPVAYNKDIGNAFIHVSWWIPQYYQIVLLNFTFLMRTSLAN